MNSSRIFSRIIFIRRTVKAWYNRQETSEGELMPGSMFFREANLLKSLRGFLKRSNFVIFELNSVLPSKRSRRRPTTIPPEIFWNDTTKLLLRQLPRYSNIKAASVNEVLSNPLSTLVYSLPHLDLPHPLLRNSTLQPPKPQSPKTSLPLLCCRGQT